MPRIPPVEHVRIDVSAMPGASMMELLFRVMEHRPEIARQSLALLQATMREGTVEPELKELLAIRVSQVNNCFY
ncbi:MAG TPA: carboxymuconolactone decarboxylase family protein [Ktedonobacteraceae bacterium]|nr:carboxymuconolactone decarboxylase family protein [Ktedonobacteraceae bacterium]